MNRAVLDTFFSRVKEGGLSVRYWDGEEARYGDREPQFRIVFREKPKFVELIDDPVLAIGELYMDSDVDLEGDIETMIQLANRNAIFSSKPSFSERLSSLVWRGLRSVKKKIRQKENIQAHYDLGNDFFALWLDETMSYSCAYFKNPDMNLHQAQLAKIDLILRKLRLRPGMRLLDIGCGWGWLILRAAQQYGVKALGITLSEEQFDGALKRISDAGLSDSVEVRLVNYLDLDGQRERFDRVVSVGMFEHVGRDHLSQYMQKVHDLMVPSGVSMLHTLTSLRESKTNSWIKKYIFPGGYIPSLRETVALLPDQDFHALHIESLRRHYARTLDCWTQNFIAKLDRVRAMFGERFARMWEMYLRSSAASLRNGHIDVHQILFSKGKNDKLPMTFEDIYLAD
jgi:cyclopropane-fatty-acyl-phospholipid synthase